MRITFPQSRKAWVALAGTIITTAAVAWQQFGDLIPGLQPQTITAIGGLLTAIAAFWVPNQLTNAQIMFAQSLSPRGPNKFSPTTYAQPAPEEQPGRHPGESREHH